MSAASPLYVLVPATAHAKLFEILDSVSSRIRPLKVGVDQPLPPEAAEAEVFFRATSIPRPAVDAVFEKAKKLRWIHIPAAGVDAAFAREMGERGITLT